MYQRKGHKKENGCPDRNGNRKMTINLQVRKHTSIKGRVQEEEILKRLGTGLKGRASRGAASQGAICASICGHHWERARTAWNIHSFCPWHRVYFGGGQITSETSALKVSSQQMWRRQGLKGKLKELRRERHKNRFFIYVFNIVNDREGTGALLWFTWCLG